MKDSSRSILIWGAVVVGIIALMAVLIHFGTRSGGNSGGNGKLAAEVTTDDHIKGAADGKVTLVEYSDFQCPACGSYYPIIKKLVEDNPNDLRMVYRHYPLVQIHKNAHLAAQAAEAANNQGKFWEMHDVLFNTQKQWSDQSNPEDFFIRLAESIGLDKTKFLEDLNSREVNDRINRDIKSGDESGVQGTPTLYLNGNQIQPSTYEALQAAIDAAKNSP